MSRPSLLAALLASLAAFATYLATLAPGVTFEDSGELITAAYVAGVPHEPGYPLWTMLAHAFAQLPLGSVAWRVNLFSALGAAIGVLFFARALQRCVPAPLALCGALLAAFSREGWSQSLITEVYGLNLALFGLALDLLVRWSLEENAQVQRRCLVAFALVLGLAVSNHTTAALWGPAALLTALLQRPRQLLDARLIAQGVGAFLAGLLPLAYLPWAAARDPVLNWGDPSSLKNFIAVVIRQQYGVDPARSLHDVYVQLSFLARLTAEQWPAVLLLLVPAGLWQLSRRPRALLTPLLLLWLCTGPIVAVLTDFPVATPNAITNAENAALASVFFIPAHWLVAFVVTLGLGLVVERLSPAVARAATACALLLPLATAAAQWPRVDMSRQVFAQRYVAGLFKLAEPGALILTTWDPYFFPTLYAQHVEHQRPDVVVLDQFSLSTGWYVRQLQRKVPSILSQVEPQAQMFLEGIDRYEAGEPNDYAATYARYRELVEGIIDAAVAAHRDVLLTFEPSAETRRRHAVEPLYWAYRLRATPGVTAAEPAQLGIADFLSPALEQDRMAAHVRDQLVRTMRERSTWCAEQGHCPDQSALAGLLESFEAARRATFSAPAR